MPRRVILWEVVKTLALVVLLAGTAHADPRDRAEEAGGEANLESNAPRAGLTVSGAVGAGVTMGDGAGRGPAVSFRLGHVATSSTILTFEITGGLLQHQRIGDSTVLHNDFFGVMVGGLHYVSGSMWLRGAGGLVGYTIDAGDTMSSTVHGGLGGLGGIGVDLVRWHYLVLGLETFGQLAAVSTRGVMFNSGLCLGFTYY